MEEPYKDIQKLVKEVGADHPSSYFVKNVMDEVMLVSSQKQFTYKPLISKKTWAFIIFSFLSLIIVLPFFATDTVSMVANIDFSFLSNNLLKKAFTKFKFHNITVYSVLFFSILFIVQLFFIKRKIDKMFSF
ncbi:hypothetical protein GCM10022393_30550 [Aquimarina addita]|uniref:Uncharacterized protein n=1 Tax=Aquimarina addita TaxID=870485 RepID=A0ABP6UNE3_9FLAO